jgi:nucleotide-binding universal stress UspA family protein
MFERILVPLDGSTRAAHAVAVAACIAGRQGQAQSLRGSVILVSVVNHFILSQHPRMDRNNKIWASDDISISEAEAYLDEMTSAPELAHVRVEKVILSGPVASTLLSAATSYRANAIVLTSHGRSGIMSKTLGSVAEKVFCEATIPVLLLRENSRLPLAPYYEIYNGEMHVNV